MELFRFIIAKLKKWASLQSLARELRCKYRKLLACAKHFAVHSGPEALRHQFNAVASPKDLNETYLPAFKALIEAGL